MRGGGQYKTRLMWMIHTATDANDGSGAVVDSWADERDLWCAIEQPRGADRMYWGAVQVSVDCVVRVHGNVGVRSVDRFRDASGRVYLINGISDDIENGDQICVCATVTETAAA